MNCSFNEKLTARSISAMTSRWSRLQIGRRAPGCQPSENTHVSAPAAFNIHAALRLGQAARTVGHSWLILSELIKTLALVRVQWRRMSLEFSRLPDRATNSRHCRGFAGLGQEKSRQ
jgi:hypothetical protein